MTRAHARIRIGMSDLYLSIFTKPLMRRLRVDADAVEAFKAALSSPMDIGENDPKLAAHHAGLTLPRRTRPRRALTPRSVLQSAREPQQRTWATQSIGTLVPSSLRRRISPGPCPHLYWQSKTPNRHRFAQRRCSRTRRPTLGASCRTFIAARRCVPAHGRARITADCRLNDVTDRLRARLRSSAHADEWTFGWTSRGRSAWKSSARRQSRPGASNRTQGMKTSLAWLRSLGPANRKTRRRGG